jgi:uncharacterized protein
MFFAVIALDKPGLRDKRMETRPAHRAYGDRTDLPARKILGVALTEDDGRAMNGTLLVVEAPDRAAAEAYVAGDPYVKAGVFERTSIVAIHESFAETKALLLAKAP